MSSRNGSVARLLCGWYEWVRMCPQGGAMPLRFWHPIRGPTLIIRAGPGRSCHTHACFERSPRKGWLSPCCSPHRVSRSRTTPITGPNPAMTRVRIRFRIVDPTRIMTSIPKPMAPRISMRNTILRLIRPIRAPYRTIVRLPNPTRPSMFHVPRSRISAIALRPIRSTN